MIFIIDLHQDIYLSWNFHLFITCCDMMFLIKSSSQGSKSIIVPSQGDCTWHWNLKNLIFIWVLRMSTNISMYRVSQKKRSHVLNGCNSYKIGTRNKIRVSFEKFMKLSFHWAQKLSHFDSWGLRKIGLKMVTLLLKLWSKKLFFKFMFLPSPRP